MAYPRMEKYVEAMQNYQKFLFDPELKQGTLKRNGMGLPTVISGGFALTYTINCTNTYAVRCFHKESKSLEERYKSISRKLKELHSEYFLDFEYQKKGILVEGNIYPIVKMSWANGVTLGEFIESNFDNKQALQNLANEILLLSRFLEKNKISHGDIQTGNMMVSDSGKVIQLIDYDGFYIDSISHLGSAEIGHVNFQHPERARKNPFNERNDRFSLIVIWLALISLIEDSNLWHKTRSDIDTFIFRANDYASPSSSTTFSLLNSYDKLKPYINHFIKICLNCDLDAIPNLDTFSHTQSNIIDYVPMAGSTTRQNYYISQYPVISAHDYNSCIDQVGNQVEVIGKIIAVKKGTTRNGKPYIFINFGDWRGNIFKVAIWSQGIDKLNEVPDDSWLGKWVSIKGLMENPYTSYKFNYTHISISVSKNGQLSIIGTEEATFRLSTYVSRPAPNTYTSPMDTVFEPVRKKQKTTNKDKLHEIQRTESHLSPPHKQARPVKTFSNRDILSRINAANQSKPSQPRGQRNKHTQEKQYKVSDSLKGRDYNVENNHHKKSESDSSILSWIVIFVSIIILLRACS